MAFDISTAKPVKSGFDISTAKPIDTTPPYQRQPNFPNEVVPEWGMKHPYLYGVARTLTTEGAPIIEAGGGIAGAIAGIPGGPPGMVEGAGLGTAGANRLVAAANQLLQFNKPETLSESAKNALISGAYGAAGEAGGQILGATINATSQFLKARAARKAADIIRQSAATSAPEVVNALQAAGGKDISSAQALAQQNVISPTTYSLFESVGKANEQGALNIAKQKARQEAASRSALIDLTGGAITPTEVKQMAITGRSAVNKETSALREQGLDAANLLSRRLIQIQDFANQMGEKAVQEVENVRNLVKAGNIAEASARMDMIEGRLPSGMKAPEGLWDRTYKGELAQKADQWASEAANRSLGAGQARDVSQMAADKLTQEGVKPLTAEKITSSLRSLITPQRAGSDAINVVDEVISEINKWKSADGLVDAHALDSIKKNVVRTFLEKNKVSGIKRSEDQLVGLISPIIDKAIVDAGGSAYKTYLTEHAKLMSLVNQKQLTGKALELWNKQDKTQFMQLVQGGNPETVAKIMGKKNFDIAKSLADSQMTILNNEVDKILTDKLVSSQATDGQQALSSLLKENMSWVHRLPFFSVKVTAVNELLKKFESAIGKKTMGHLIKAANDPAYATDLLKGLPKSEQTRVQQIINSPHLLVEKQPTGSKAGIATAVGVKNLLAPPQQSSENNLANQGQQ